LILLGPQRADPDVGRVLADVGTHGPVALITAGWQEWEEEDDHLRKALGPGSLNLRLYGRAERVWQDDPELADGHRELQLQVGKLRHAYNVRLASAMGAWIDLERMTGDPRVLDAERLDALEVVKALDRHHVRRLGALRRMFYESFDPLHRSAVVREREEIRQALEPVGSVVVGGGHVPALLNRLRLFGAGDFLADRVLVACSGGAMAVASRVVLFHDSPPWGPGHAEVGEVGLGLFSGVVALPDGSARLRLDDPVRVSRLARRFAPDACVVLDPGSRAEWDGRWHGYGSQRLTQEGHPAEWMGAA
jgi:hypothetical protein